MSEEARKAQSERMKARHTAKRAENVVQPTLDQCSHQWLPGEYRRTDTGSRLASAYCPRCRTWQDA
jgi:hypothetical protein